ncbi:hypothetical protein MTO96_035064, partial [Rhipicephalus appendiculatus]
DTAPSRVPPRHRSDDVGGVLLQVPCDSGLCVTIQRSTMANLSAKRKRPSLEAFAESGDTSSIVDHGGAECYGPSCTAYEDQVCQITYHLTNFNELLFEVGMELREQRGGSLSLASIDISDVKPDTSSRSRFTQG